MDSSIDSFMERIKTLASQPLSEYDRITEDLQHMSQDELELLIDNIFAEIDSRYDRGQYE